MLFREAKPIRNRSVLVYSAQVPGAPWLETSVDFQSMVSEDENELFKD